MVKLDKIAFMESQHYEEPNKVLQELQASFDNNSGRS